MCYQNIAAHCLDVPRFTNCAPKNHTHVRVQNLYAQKSESNCLNIIIIIILHTVICDHYGRLGYKHLGLVMDYPPGGST